MFFLYCFVSSERQRGCRDIPGGFPACAGGDGMKTFYPLCELGLDVFPVLNPSGIFCSLHVSSGDVRVGGGWCLEMVDGHVVLDDGASCGGSAPTMFFRFFLMRRFWNPL
jgi:hypothetical protein